MVGKSASPWLRSVLRSGKRQQRAAVRVLAGLLTPPKPAAKPKPKPKPSAAAKPKPQPKARKAPPARPTVSPFAAAAPAAPSAPPARAALPAPAPAPGKWLASHYVAGMRRLSYWLYLPDCLPPPAGLPLIVMLHGCDQSATLFAQGTRMNQLAGQAGYAVLYPQQSVSAHPHRCWKWYDRATQQGGGDVPLIVGLVGEVLARHGIDRTRVYIGGMSAGAGMAHIVALNHPELFAAVGLHSGPLYGAGHSPIGALAVMKHGSSARVDSAIAELQARRPGFPPLPTILIAGEDDEVVRPVNQAQLARQARLLNALPADVPVRVALKAGQRRAHPYRLDDVFQGRRLMLRVARIAELKHAWSGGDASLSFNSGAGPDASKMLVDFFGRHKRVIR